jgi:uncharacterized protein YodC (DUF2158 family)
MLFKVGDIVQLKSGGPSMTITETSVAGPTISYACTWFDGPNQMWGHFLEETLKHSPDPKPTTRRR